MRSIVTAAGITKRYGHFTALRDVCFSIEPGSIVGLIGPNGAGKTTTLRSILGLTDFEGQMEVLGQDPRASRHRIMERVCFVADVGVYLDGCAWQMPRPMWQGCILDLTDNDFRRCWQTPRSLPVKRSDS